MTVSLASMTFDVVLSVLLAVMIWYAVRLNRQIVSLRERESEMLTMIQEFNHSSAAAHAAASSLKSAGTEAEFGVKAAVAKAMALRNDLELMIDKGSAVAEKLDVQATMHARSQPQRPANNSLRPPMPRPAPEPPAEMRQEAPPAGSVRPFAPPPRSRDEVVNTAPPPAPETAPEVAAAAAPGRATGYAAAQGAGPAPAPGSGNELQPRTEAERQLLEAIRAAKEGVI